MRSQHQTLKFSCVIVMPDSQCHIGLCKYYATKVYVSSSFVLTSGFVKCHYPYRNQQEINQQEICHRLGAESIIGMIPCRLSFQARTTLSFLRRLLYRKRHFIHRAKSIVHNRDYAPNTCQDNSIIAHAAIYIHGQEYF